MAMGQRGTYLAVSESKPTMKQSLTFIQMHDHAGMLERSSTHLDIEECRREPERAWEEWKEQESRHRYVSPSNDFRLLLTADPDSHIPG